MFVTSIQEEDTKIKDVEMAILKIKTLVDTADSKTLIMRKQLKREDTSTGRSHQSMLEMRS